MGKQKSTTKPPIDFVCIVFVLVIDTLVIDTLVIDTLVPTPWQIDLMDRGDKFGVFEFFRG